MIRTATSDSAGKSDRARFGLLPRRIGGYILWTGSRIPEVSSREIVQTDFAELEDGPLLEMIEDPEDS